MKTLCLSLIFCVSSALTAQTTLRDSAANYFNSHVKNFNYTTYEWQLYADSALLIDPKQDDVWHEKAMPYLKNGDFGSWIRYIAKAVEYNPKEWLPYRAFCRMIFMKDYEAALTDFELSEKYNKSTVNYIMDHTYDFYKGLCYLETNRLDLAQKHLQKSIDYQLKERGAEWTHFNDLFYLGEIYFEQKNKGKALFYLDMALKNYKLFPDANYYKALVLKSLNRNLEAIDFLTIAQDAYKRGYRMNEDNEFYANYPKQIGIAEIEKLLVELKK